MPSVSAQTTPDLGELTESSWDARQKAYDYSFETGGIGVVVSYGQKNGVTPQQIGNAFVEEINKRGFPSRYFYYTTNRDGMGMSFRVRASVLGPWDVDEAASNMTDIIKRAEAVKRAHGN